MSRTRFTTVSVQSMVLVAVLALAVALAGTSAVAAPHRPGRQHHRPGRHHHRPKPHKPAPTSGTDVYTGNTVHNTPIVVAVTHNGSQAWLSGFAAGGYARRQFGSRGTTKPLAWSCGNSQLVDALSVWSFLLPADRAPLNQGSFSASMQPGDVERAYPEANSSDSSFVALSLTGDLRGSQITGTVQPQVANACTPAADSYTATLSPGTVPEFSPPGGGGGSPGRGGR
jgi:hypothetical protein